MPIRGSGWHNPLQIVMLRLPNQSLAPCLLLTSFARTCLPIAFSLLVAQNNPNAGPFISVYIVTIYKKVAEFTKHAQNFFCDCANDSSFILDSTTTYTPLCPFKQLVPGEVFLKQVRYRLAIASITLS